ncbi:MAG: hypothetical protein A2474_02595 [Elusimicrobia bacterium RIFOXYC2_FULL_34_12]|nr:MAG: hypothetical protein A2474_02595 [Elusimicrobia bacterium RIFOXYC2_FULL_34_12]OGS39025.1 MAG: hypothetical protein A2551_07330 [Elusimicrobia bacterium RIFOXYD2_FULL_34_30]HAM39688.1 RNA-binding protein [Elusimicrobiota bacterium]
MKELVEYIVKSLVDNTDKVDISIVDSEIGKVVNIKVDDADKGRIIGKQGRIIKAIRQVVSASATRKNEKYRVEVVE